MTGPQTHHSSTQQSPSQSQNYSTSPAPNSPSSSSSFVMNTLNTVTPAFDSEAALNQMPAALRKVLRRKDQRLLASYMPLIKIMQKVAEERSETMCVAWKPGESGSSKSGSKEGRLSIGDDDNLDMLNDEQDNILDNELESNKDSGSIKDKNDPQWNLNRSERMSKFFLSAMVSPRRYKGIFKPALSLKRRTAWIACEG
ncbi:MAG: hypothetical protein EZS28_054705, partial [Streblomastix strix]